MEMIFDALGLLAAGVGLVLGIVALWIAFRITCDWFFGID
jgi:hypothetical protein